MSERFVSKRKKAREFCSPVREVKAKNILPVWGVFVFILFLAHAAAGEIFDRIDLGVSQSEAAHDLQTKGSEVVDYEALPEPDVRVTEVTASTDERAAINTIDGDKGSRWGGVSSEVWVQYELSRATDLDQVRIRSRNAEHENPVEILVSSDGEDWENVYSGRTTGDKGGSGRFPEDAEWQTFSFDSVSARYVRIVLSEGKGAHGGQLWLWQVRLGDLEWPDAYARNAQREALGEAGRRLTSRLNTESQLDGEDWMGGWMSFDIATAPDEQNYVTLKISGSDRPSGGLAFMLDPEEADGVFRWLNTRRINHQDGNHQTLWSADWEGHERVDGRWIYRTYPLPYEELTRGSDQVRLRIQQQHGGDAPTLYSVYSHTDPHFVPPEDEPQGEPFEWGRVRGDSELDIGEEELKGKGRNWAEDIVADGGGNLDQLVQIYTTEWSGYYREEQLLYRAAEILDERARRFFREGAPAERWAGVGRNQARPYIKLHDGFEKTGLLGEEIEITDQKEMTRGEAYAQWFKGEFDVFHKSRRLYTNQTYYGNAGLYYLNRALLQLKPELAVSESEARWFIYELMGIVPFGPDQSDARRGQMEAGYPYHVVTDKGLTRELGYVVFYGEMTGQFAELARVIGCPILKERAEEMVRARVHFRKPDNTEEGYRRLRSIGLLGTRQSPYPAEGGHRPYLPGWRELRALGDPVSKRMCELRLQMLEEEQADRFASASSLSIEKVKQLSAYNNVPASDYRLPIEEGHKREYAWADEENGIFMIRHEDEFIWGSFYLWGAHRGYNNRGRFHHVTPLNDRIVDVVLDARAPDGGRDRLRPGFSYPEMPDGHEYVLEGRNYIIPPSSPELEQADRLVEHVDYGRLWFYQLNYGDYLIGMNTTRKNAYNASLYELEVPEEHRNKTAVDFVSGREVDLSEPVIVGPRSTMVLYLGKN